MIEPAPPPARRARRAVGLAVRLVCVAVTVWLGWYAMTTFQAVLRGPEPTTTLPPDPGPTTADRLAELTGSEAGWKLGNDPPTEPLLPLPPSVQLLARRTATDGRVQAEAVLAPAGLDPLREFWVAQGWRWEVRPGGEGVCRGAGNAIRVWSPDAAANRDVLLFLVREMP